MDKLEILEIINEIEETSLRDYKETHKISPASYGEGRLWGTVECCRRIKEEIKEINKQN
jgi:hypothetical protein|tara:strand:+ start:1007 stop:1183 length:177 start_codon:yes stop_codon:yes gene_type:complete